MTGTVTPIDAALRTGLAGAAPEMVSAFPAAAADGRVNLAAFAGERTTAAWPAVEFLELGSF